MPLFSVLSLASGVAMFRHVSLYCRPPKYQQARLLLFWCLLTFGLGLGAFASNQCQPKHLPYFCGGAVTLCPEGPLKVRAATLPQPFTLTRHSMATADIWAERAELQPGVKHNCKCDCQCPQCAGPGILVATGRAHAPQSEVQQTSKAAGSAQAAEEGLRRESGG